MRRALIAITVLSFVGAAALVVYSALYSGGRAWPAISAAAVALVLSGAASIYLVPPRRK